MNSATKHIMSVLFPLGRFVRFKQYSSIVIKRRVDNHTGRYSPKRNPCPGNRRIPVLTRGVIVDMQAIGIKSATRLIKTGSLYLHVTARCRIGNRDIVQYCF